MKKKKMRRDLRRSRLFKALMEAVKLQTPEQRERFFLWLGEQARREEEENGQGSRENS